MYGNYREGLKTVIFRSLKQCHLDLIVEKSRMHMQCPFLDGSIIYIHVGGSSSIKGLTYLIDRCSGIGDKPLVLYCIVQCNNNIVVQYAVLHECSLYS